VLFVRPNVTRLETTRLRIAAITRRAWLFLLLALAVAACADDDRGFVLQDARSIFLRDGFLNIAHRGGARLAPEHTLVAYGNGLDVGADVIELDLHATADGVIVSIHDTTVDRTTNGTGLVRDMSFDELRQLDAGYRFTRDGGQTYPWRGQELTVPSLEEALDLLEGTPLSVEIKQAFPSIVEPVLDAIAARGAVNDTVFASFSGRVIQRIRELRPDALTAFNSGELVEFVLLDDSELDSYEPPSRFIQPPWDGVDSVFMERAHKLGLKVHPWTVNRVEDMQAMLDIGVDGLFTDDPARLHELASEATSQGRGSASRSSPTR
jgi:glycerophosphoryl diester phosphodiesterase